MKFMQRPVVEIFVHESKIRRFNVKRREGAADADRRAFECNLSPKTLLVNKLLNAKRFFFGNPAIAGCKVGREFEFK